MKTFFNDDNSKPSGPKKSINKDKSSNDAIEKRKKRFCDTLISKSNKDEIKDIPLPSTSRQQITLSDVKKTSTPLSPTRQIMNQLAKQAIANIPLPKKQVPQLIATTSAEPQSVPTKRLPIKISFNKKELATASTPSFTSQSSTNQRKSLPATKKSGNQINYSSESSGDEDVTKKSSSDNTLNVGFKLASAPTLQRLSKSTPSINKLESTPKTMMPFSNIRQILTATKKPANKKRETSSTPSTSTEPSLFKSTKQQSIGLGSDEEFAKPKKSRQAIKYDITDDEELPSFQPAQKRKRPSISYERHDEEDDSIDLNRSYLSKRARIDEKIPRSSNDSFFRSPATPHSTYSKFKNPPVYEGKDGRYYVAFFTNKYIFSNHFICPKGVVVDDMEFPTTEHYYMYSKAIFHNDMKAANKIRKCEDPKEAKRITTRFENFDTNGWKRLQYKVMEKACLAKFQQNPDLRRELFRTCNAVLVEASPSDQRWGVGLDMQNPDVSDESKWRGSNLLGNLLINVRAKLATEFADEFDQEFDDAQKDLKRRANKC